MRVRAPFIAMLVGFSTLAVAILVFRSSPARRGSLFGLTIAALITLALQVFMGPRVCSRSFRWTGSWAHPPSSHSPSSRFAP
jgi:hypothetical protein